MTGLTATHRWICHTCNEPILPGAEIQFAQGRLFRAYHPGACWKNRPRTFRSKQQVQAEVMGLKPKRGAE